MLYIKFQGNQSTGSREEICKDQPKVIICAIMVILGYPMLLTKFQGHWSTGSVEEDFYLGFYHIWAWWPYRSCDLEGLYVIFIPSAQGGSKRNLVTFCPVGYRRS